MHNTGMREMDNAKGFPLGERQFLEFAFTLIRFSLTLGCAGELIVRLKRAGGPLTQAITWICRAQELHRADCEQEEKQPVSNHDLDLPPRKSEHRTMSSTPSAIAPRLSRNANPDTSIYPTDKSVSPSHVVCAGPYWGYPESRPFCGRHYSASAWCGSVRPLMARTRCQRRRQFGLPVRIFRLSHSPFVTTLRQV